MQRLSGPARALALQLFAEARAEWAFASEIIARGFRSRPELSSSERRRVAETVYALIRQHRRLEAIAGDLLGRRRLRPEDLAAPALDELRLLLHEVHTDGVPAEAVAADTRRVLGGAAPVDLAWAADPDAGLGGRTGVERDAVRLSYPTWIVERLIDDLGRQDGLALAAAMNQRAPLTIRANTARIARDELLARLAEEGVEARPTRLASAGLVLETRVNAFGLGAFREGLFEVMDEGSQLVAELVAPPPGGRVVDACAGAGGKTLAVGVLLGGKGRVLALDVGGRKLEELRRRARRAGLTNVTARALEDEGRLPAEARLASWDRVLVDAPCSGLGTLRRNPEARWRMTPQAAARFPARQLGLLVTYAPLCAVGGRLVYATCTVLADENDRVVDRFLADRDDFVRVPVKETWGKVRAAEVGDGLCLRVYPHLHDTDGFYAAVLRRLR